MAAAHGDYGLWAGEMNGGLVPGPGGGGRTWERERKGTAVPGTWHGAPRNELRLV